MHIFSLQVIVVKIVPIVIIATNFRPGGIIIMMLFLLVGYERIYVCVLVWHLWDILHCFPCESRHYQREWQVIDVSFMLVSVSVPEYINPHVTALLLKACYIQYLALGWDRKEILPAAKIFISKRETPLSTGNFEFGTHIYTHKNTWHSKG